jgi:RNA polymerase sigma-70 factor (ECF subfamily)
MSLTETQLLPMNPTGERPADDATLIARAKAGDGAAFATLVRPILPALFRVAARIAGRAGAEDAAQEALTLAWERIDKLRPGTPFAAFVFGFAMKRAATLARGERRRKGREDKVGRGESQHRPDRPDEVNEARALQDAIGEALQRLPEKRRDAVIMRMDGGLSDRDIAAALGSTEGSVRVLVHHGLAAIEEHLKQLGFNLAVRGGKA